jgi:DNA-binding MarR family transcriptional regulator
MTTPIIPFFNESLLINLTLATASLERFIEPLLLTKDLNLPEWYTLRELMARNSPLITSELAKSVGRKPNSFTHIAKKLKKKNYIASKQLHDHRQIELSLAPKSLTIRDEFLANAEKIDDAIKSHLGDDYAHLLRILRDLQRIDVS